jgi:hypothetical protein
MLVGGRRTRASRRGTRGHGCQSQCTRTATSPWQTVSATGSSCSDQGSASGYLRCAAAAPKGTRRVRSTRRAPREPEGPVAYKRTPGLLEVTVVVVAVVEGGGGDAPPRCLRLPRAGRSQMLRRALPLADRGPWRARGHRTAGRGRGTARAEARVCRPGRGSRSPPSARTSEVRCALAARKHRATLKRGLVPVAPTRRSPTTSDTEPPSSGSGAHPTRRS